MNLLILPGNSPRHREWLRDAQKALAPFFDNILTLEYRHWDFANKKTDVDYEAKAAKELVSGWKEYVVLAKSIGTGIATTAHTQGKLKASSYVFLGLPLPLVKDDLNFYPQLQALENVVIFQNSHDPFGSSNAVGQYIASGNANIEVIETPGSTHDYVDFVTYASYLTADPSKKHSFPHK